MSVLAIFALCYALGSIPTGYWLMRWTRNVDIRTVGSGNIGATNALRTGGLAAGVIVLFVDVLKGFLAAAMAKLFLMQPSPPGMALACGTLAILGHAYSCFLGFRGGKGVATALGTLLGVSPPLAVITVGVWLLAFLATRYVSMASITAAPKRVSCPPRCSTSCAMGTLSKEAIEAKET